MESIYGNLDAVAKQLGISRDQARDIVEDSYGRMAGREDTYSQDIINNILGSYGAAEENINRTYGRLRGESGRTFDDLMGRSGTAFDESMEELELLKPGSEAAAARSARAFAPEMARTMGRLRRAGVDPSSPQAANLLRQVGVARSRAIDDRLAEGTEKYIDRKTGLRLGKEDVHRGLGLGKLGSEVGLSRAQTGLTTDLGRERTGLVTGEKRRALGGLQNIDAARAADLLGIGKDEYNRLRDLMGEKNLAAVLEKRMGDQADLTGLGLSAQQYQMGQQQEGLNLDQKNRAAASLLGISDQQYRNMFGAAQTARGFGQDALNAYLKTLGIESKDAGWGLKLLLNAGLMGAGAAFGGGGGGFSNLPITGFPGAGGGGAYDPIWSPGGSGPQQAKGLGVKLQLEDLLRRNRRR
jgi:hypothetical protein